MTAQRRRERETDAGPETSLGEFLSGADAAAVARVHLLDCGPEEYGDALLLELGDETILIDGAHPGNNKPKEGHPALQDQIASLLGRELPVKVSLLIVSHAHEDHIGCLPALVRDGHITAEYALVPDPDLAWGREPDAPRPQLDERAAMIVAGLREEPRSPNTPDAELQQFLADAMNLEGRYREMLDTLKENGTVVVRYGRTAGYTKLRRRFTNIGLEILGPSEEQLLLAADLIANRTSDAIDAMSDQLDALDASPVDLYRQLMSIDALDGKSRPGDAVNLQSIVTRFTVGGKRFLFAGDMQFVAPGVSNDAVEESIRKLREAIAEGAPYAFAKLSHHGSDNAFDEAVLDELGKTRYLGICAGSGSTKHPHHDVLELLKKRSNEITWVRTDRNGQCTLTFGAQTRVELTEGKKNDARPNSEDVGRVAQREEPLLPPIPPAPQKETVAVQEVAADGSVEAFARVPHTRTKVTLTIDVEPYGNAAPADRGSVRRVSTIPRDWRPSPAVSKLLFVTARPALARNVGASEAETILSSLAGAGAEVLDLATASRDALRKRLASRPPGVVILGGYDVVPAQRVDCLPPRLRERLGNTEEPDDFIVWSDDIYGDDDGDGLAEVPVSRIPDGHTAAVLFGALAARSTAQPTRAGVRNTARPFAKDIFASLPGSGDIRASKPQCFNNPAFTLDGHHVYLMLHGDYTDGSRFWGEGTLNNAEAMNVSNIPDPAPAVVLTGCCWGALTVDKPAGRWTEGQSLGIKSPDGSIALTFLARGARAYVGCTGAHYSPTTPPYDYFGGPMHAAFWRAYRSGKAPAQALFDAKIDFLAGMPHQQRTDTGQAIEFKIWRQYTCLGLGW